MIKQTLIVDDQADIRDLLATALSLHGYMIKSAESREEALRIFEEVPCDVIFLDWYMPGMPALEFVQRVRAIKPDVRIVLITSKSEVQEKAALLQSDFYLGKPFDYLEMMRTIQQCLAS